jgi:hypothetical protein
VLCHKLREAIAAERNGIELDGEVEVDGMYVGGHIRPANHVENRVDRRLAKHQTGKRRVVVAFRQRKGRTLPFVTRTEAEGVALAIENVDRMAVLHADEASHWDHLHDGWQVGRINHSESYSDNGVCTNQVESYFSRLRRMIGGQHHHVSPRYLHQFANHAAWLEDHRRESNGELANRLNGLGDGAPG